MNFTGKYIDTFSDFLIGDIPVRIPAKALIFFLSGFFIFNQRSFSQPFHPVANTITPMSNAQTMWADLNNDQLSDLVVSGLDQTGVSSIIWYENNGDSTFNSQEIARLSEVAFDLTDYDQDGFIDLLVAGKTSADKKVLRVYRNNGGLSFTDQGFALTGVTQGDVLWADLDHDTKPEIVATGLDASGNESIRMYRQEGTQYQPVEHTMTPLSYGKCFALDANKDGLTELLVSGFDALGNPTTIIYTIETNFNTTIYDEGIDGFAQHALAAADINADGFEDLIMAGIGADLEKATLVYINNQTNGFIRQSTLLLSVNNASLASGDVNNDGLTDLLLMGLDEAGDPQSRYYENTGLAGSSGWSEFPGDFEPLFSGSLALSELNLDGSLDLFQTGNANGSFKANLYTSDIHLSRPNQPPAAPAGLTPAPTQNRVTLSWSASSDDLTAPASLSYNVYISGEAGGADMMLSPMASVASGARRIAKRGNAGYALQATFNNIPQGRYYWSVQAIDNAHQGSTFAGEEAFVICDPTSLGADTAVCFEETISLSVGEAGDMVNWYSLRNDVTLVLDQLSYEHLVTEKDTLVAELTKADLGCVLYDTIVIDVIGPIAPELGPDFSVCPDEEVSLTLSGYDQVNWFTRKQGLIRADHETISFSLTEKDTVIAEVFFGGGCVQYDSVIVDVFPAVEVSLRADTSVCAGEILELQLEGFETVNWYLGSKGLVVSGSESFLYKATQDNQIIAEGIDFNGCSGFDTLNISVIPLPKIDLGADTSICFGATLELLAERFEAVSWSSVRSGWLADGPEFIFQGMETDTIIIEVWNELGCQQNDTLIIEVFSSPEVDLGLDVVVCEGEMVLLEQQDPSFQQIDWLDISGSSLVMDQWFYTETFFKTDTLVTQVTDINGCVNSDTIIVQVNPLPVFQLQDTAVCQDTELKLRVDGTWDEVNWLTLREELLAEDQPEYFFPATAPITLRAEVYQNGCVSYDTAIISIKSLPEIVLDEEISYCFGDEMAIDPGVGGVNYTWSNEASEIISDQQILRGPAITNEQYFVSVTNEEGCSIEDSIRVVVNALPGVRILGTPEICQGDEVTLSSSLEDYQASAWYRGPGDTLLTDSRDLQFFPEGSAMIYLWLQDQQGCAGQDSVMLTVHPTPLADAGPDQFICFGEEVEIGENMEPRGDWTFLWQGPALSSTDVSRPAVAPTTSSWYSLTVTNGFDCQSSDSVFVYVEPELLADAGPDRILCEGESVMIGADITPNPDLQYQWTPETGLSSSQVARPTVTIDADQTFVLSVFSGDCGPVHDTVFVSVKSKPKVEVTPTQSIGPGSSVRLEASGGVSYRWEPAALLDNPNLPDPLASPLSTTLFTVEVENDFGCSVTDSVMVLIQNVLFIPNLFTPNGDGSNDEFRIYGSGITKLQLSIYDLNGALIHTISDPEEALLRGWDGTKNGSVLPNGSYIWMITGRFHDGSPLEFNGQQRGMVSLMR